MAASVFWILNVLTDVEACDGKRGLYGHRRKRVCTKSSHYNNNNNVKFFAAPGTRTRVSIAPGFSV